VRRRTPDSATTLKELVAHARRAPAGDLIATGMVEGLTGRGRIQVAPHPDERLDHQTGRLIGRFLQWVDSTGRALDHSLIMLATAYLTWVSHDVRSGDSILLAGGPRAIMKTHTCAMIYAARRAGEPSIVGEELLLISWLAGQVGLRPTDDAGRQVGRSRALRHRRLFPDAAAPEDPAST
jgi:hypothetical protein